MAIESIDLSLTRSKNMNLCIFVAVFLVGLPFVSLPAQQLSEPVDRQQKVLQLRRELLNAESLLDAILADRAWPQAGSSLAIVKSVVPAQLTQGSVYKRLHSRQCVIEVLASVEEGGEDWQEFSYLKERRFPLPADWWDDANIGMNSTMVSDDPLFADRAFAFKSTPENRNDPSTYELISPIPPSWARGVREAYAVRRSHADLFEAAIPSEQVNAQLQALRSHSNEVVRCLAFLKWCQIHKEDPIDVFKQITSSSTLSEASVIARIALVHLPKGGASLVSTLQATPKCELQTLEAIALASYVTLRTGDPEVLGILASIQALGEIGDAENKKYIEDSAKRVEGNVAVQLLCLIPSRVKHSDPGEVLALILDATNVDHLIKMKKAQQ
jgi:hypothetical protein